MPRKISRSAIPKIIERIAALYQLKIITSEQKDVLGQYTKTLLKNGEVSENDILFLYKAEHPLAEELAEWILEL